MEGYLVKWTNIISGWKRRYVVISGDQLSYYKSKDGKKKGIFSLRSMQLEVCRKNPTEFRIKFVGGGIFRLRASSAEEKIKWVEAIHKSSNLAQAKEVPEKDTLTVTIEEYTLMKSQLIGTVKNRLINGSAKLSKAMTEICHLQELINRSLDEIFSKIKDLPPEVVKLKDTVREASNDLNHKLEEVAYEVEDSKAEITNSVKNLLIKSKDSPSNSRIIMEDSKKAIMSEESSPEEASFFDEVFYDAVCDSTFIATNFTPESNLDVSAPDLRLTLPFKRNQMKKVSIWTILKDLVGKDLTKITLPVYLNEPLGLLQKIAEGFENDHLLDKAAKESDPLLRLAYIAAFNAAQYNCCLGDRMKPFNPILGETFEFVTNRYRLFSEQVSHHPPISACHVENKNYEIYFHSEVTNRFWGNSIEFKPLGKMYLYLKTFKQHYILDRPITLARNIIFGKLYLDLSGDTYYTNQETGERCALHFHKKGWSSDGYGKLSGSIYNGIGEKVYELGGKWLEAIYAVNVKTGDKIPIWQKFPLPEGWHDLYCFTTHTLQLNYLPEKLKPILPHTDSRLRPDQRAYENGDVKLAAAEKHRLEEKQRARRKAMEKAKIDYNPAYFVRKVDAKTKEQYFLFNGKYWDDRERHNFSHLPDLF